MSGFPAIHAQAACRRRSRTKFADVVRELAPADLRDRSRRATSRRSGSRRCRSTAPSARRRGLRERAQGLLMVLPPVAVIAVFIGFPVVAAIAYTLGRAGGPNSVVASIGQRQFIVHHGVTLDAYRDILGNATIHRDLWATDLGDDRRHARSSSSSAGRSPSTCASPTRGSPESCPRCRSCRSSFPS